MTLEQLIEQSGYIESLIADPDVANPEMIDRFNRLQKHINIIINYDKQN